MTPAEKQKDTFQFPPIVEHYYEFCVWLLPKVSKFQKDQKYILGTRLQNNALDVLEHILDAALSEKSQKQPHLENALFKIEHLRFTFRLSVQIKMINPKSYAFGSEQILKVSKMLNGWKNHISFGNTHRLQQYLSSKYQLNFTEDAKNE